MFFGWDLKEDIIKASLLIYLGKLYEPKEQGGLTFRNLTYLDIVLVSKLV